MLKKLLKSPFTALFDEAQLLPEIRRSILFMIMGNMCGNLFNVISAGTALTGLTIMIQMRCQGEDGLFCQGVDDIFPATFSRALARATPCRE
jgi:hypothetical protein